MCNSKNSLASHIMAHSSKSSFHCKRCGYMCMSKFSLSRHIGKCGENNNYECKQCISKFRYAKDLQQHALIVHKNNEPFYCSVCNSHFVNKSSLKIH